MREGGKEELRKHSRSGDDTERALMNEGNATPDMCVYQPDWVHCRHDRYIYIRTQLHIQ